MRVSSLAVVVCAGIGGCSGPVETDDKTGNTGTNPPVEDSATLIDSGTAPVATFEPRSFRIEADFGFDGATNTLVDIQTPTGALGSAIVLMFGTKAWVDSGFDSAITDQYCVYVFPLTDSAFASWAIADPSVYYGVDFTGTAADVSTNCGDEDHPMTPLFTSDDLTASLLDPAYGHWGAGVGDIADPLYTGPYAMTTTYLFENLIGGRIQNTMGFESDLFYSYPVQLDPVTFEVQVDADGLPLLVPQSQVWTGSALSTAWYAIRTNVYYTFN